MRYQIVRVPYRLRKYLPMYFSRKTNEWEFWEQPKGDGMTKTRAFFTQRGAMKCIKKLKEF